MSIAHKAHKAAKLLKWELAKLTSVGLNFNKTTNPPLAIRDDTWLELSNVGTPRPYVKTFQFRGEGINAFHGALAKAPLGRMGVPFCIDIGIDGYLAQAEAMKLYELAYFSDGDILELGTFCGLSASILTRALADRSAPGRLDTCDINPSFSEQARKTVGDRRANYHVGDAPVLLDQFIEAKKKYCLAFIDHWHGYKETYDALIRMPSLLLPGGFVVMHDYNDRSSLDADHPHKVFQAAADTIHKDPSFRFVCIVASMAVFQRCS